MRSSSLVLVMALCAALAAVHCAKQPEKKVEAAQTVKMPDGSTVTLNNKKTLENFGVQKDGAADVPRQSMDLKEESMLRVKYVYKLDKSKLAIIPALPENEMVVGIDTMFKTSPAPYDPDIITLKDSNGTLPIGILAGRVHLDATTGRAITDSEQMNEKPEWFRVLLIYRVRKDFTTGLLYYQGKPEVSVKLDEGPAEMPALDAAVKPQPPANPPPELPKKTDIPFPGLPGMEHDHDHEHGHEHGDGHTH